MIDRRGELGSAGAAAGETTWAGVLRMVPCSAISWKRCRNDSYTVRAAAASRSYSRKVTICSLVPASWPRIALMPASSEARRVWAILTSLRMPAEMRPISCRI